VKAKEKERQMKAKPPKKQRRKSRLSGRTVNGPLNRNGGAITCICSISVVRLKCLCRLALLKVSTHAFPSRYVSAP
jgi:hypothetical protein